MIFKSVERLGGLFVVQVGHLECEDACLAQFGDERLVEERVLLVAHAQDSLTQGAEIGAGREAG